MVEENDHTWLVDMVIQLLNSDTWKAPIHEFLLDNCVKFDNFQDENRHEFYLIHQEFRNLVDSLLTAQLLEVDMDAQDFERQVMESGIVDDPRFREEISKLTAADDFVVFKDMMVGKHHELQMNAEAGLLMMAAEEERRNQFAAEAASMEEAARVAAAADAEEEAQRAAAAGQVPAPAAAAPAPAAPAVPAKLPTAAEERSFTAAGGTYGRAQMPAGGKKVPNNEKAAAIRAAIMGAKK